MALVFIPIVDFMALNRKCPSCLGEVDIVDITDTKVHISCHNCTWDDLARAVYQSVSSLPRLPYDEINPVHPL